MNNLIKIAVLFCVFSRVSFAQDIQFGKVSTEELQEKMYTKDSTADAVVLYRKMSVTFNYIQSEGFVIKKKIHERIKIYNKGGFKYGTVVESLYQETKSKENLRELKAYTYNLNGKVIEKTELKRSDTFSEESSKHYKKEKFTMPNLKEGSIIEFQYVINSPFYSSFNEIILQYDIPILTQEIKVAIPEYFIFKNVTKGFLIYNINRSSKQGGKTFINRNKFRTNVSSIEMKEVPALKEEIYVNSMENYRSAIKYELQYIKFPGRMIENYTGSWEKVVEKIYKNEDFGSQLKINKFYKQDLIQILHGKTLEKEKLDAVFGYVQSKMHWNGLYGYYVDEGVKKAYALKTGNVADINLLLVNMLRRAGLNANPVLVSTRSNGVPFFPTRYGFNYVVAAVEMDGTTIFLDATSKNSKPNMLPVRALNWAGRIVKEGGASSSVSLIPEYLSLESVMMNVNIAAEGSIKGKARRTCKDYIAYNFRNSNIESDEDTYLEKLEEKYDGIEISDYRIENKQDVGKPISESFSFFKEEGIELLSDKMYISPLFWFSQIENPFKAEERDYPVDFTFPWQDKHLVTLNIPEGYKVEFIPASVNLMLGDEVGKFTFQIQESSPGKIQVKSELTINQAIVSTMNYQGLKDFYKAVVEKQTEKVVLSKI